MSESMADFEKEIDESLKTLNVVENEGEATEEETGFNAWDKVQQYLEDGTVLTLKVGGIVNKGVIVYVDGLRGFIPASHLEIGYVEDTNPYLGKTVEAKVITADPEKNRLVLSVKEVLYDKKRAEKEARINAIEAGAVLTGKVESLMPYGAFVEMCIRDRLLSKKMFFPSFSRDILICIPEPSTSVIGFGIKVAYNPCLFAMVFTTILNVMILSAVTNALSYLKSISCCAGATS